MARTSHLYLRPEDPAYRHDNGDGTEQWFINDCWDSGRHRILDENRPTERIEFEQRWTKGNLAKSNNTFDCQYEEIEIVGKIVRCMPINPDQPDGGYVINFEIEDELYSNNIVRWCGEKSADCELQVASYEEVSKLLIRTCFVDWIERDTLCGSKSPLLNHKMMLKVRLYDVAINRFSGQHTPICFSRIMGLKAHKPTARALRRLQRIKLTVSEPASVIFHDTAGRQEFEDSGFHAVRNLNPDASFCTCDYLRRCEILKGCRFNRNQRRFTKSGKVRSMMLVIARNSDFPNNDLVTFVCIEKSAGHHILYPIWVGDPFWAQDESDSDVMTIEQECRSRNETKQKLWSEL